MVFFVGLEKSRWAPPPPSPSPWPPSRSSSTSTPALKAQESPALGCDSEDELLANLRWLHDACSQAGESFAEADALVPDTVTTRGCAEVARRVAHECDGLLLRSPVWFAGRKAALDAAVASAAAIPDGVEDVYHISDPSLRTIHTCGAVLDDGFAQFPSIGSGQSRVAINVGPSRGSLRLDFEPLTLDQKANDNLRLYSDEDEDHELMMIKAVCADEPNCRQVPPAGPISPIDVSGSFVRMLLVSDGASQNTSFRVTIGCVCEDSTGFVDADGDGCEAYVGAKHGRCADLTTADREARSACPLACGACEAGPCDASPCQNGGTCAESPAADAGHRRLQTGAEDRYGGGEACGAADLAARSAAVNAECCEEPTGDCSSGAPATCNSRCAAVLRPYVQECSATLAQTQTEDVEALLSLLQSTVQLCDLSMRGYRCSCAAGWMGEECGIEAPPPPPTSVWHWSRSYSGITITEQNAVATMTSNNGCCYGAVVSTPFFPGSADSYVEFTLTGDAAQSVMVGIARSDFDPTVPVTNGGYHYGAYGTAAGWMMEAASGAFYHDYVHAQAATTWTRVTGPWTNPDEPWGPTTLEAAPATPAAQPGDTIGMWLHAGSLTVYLNGELVGVMCQGLVGNLVWAADLGDNAGGPLPEGVRIASGDPPHTCCSTRCYPCGSGTACDFCDGSCNSPGPAHCDQTHPEWANGCDRSC